MRGRPARCCGPGVSGGSRIFLEHVDVVFNDVLKVNMPPPQAPAGDAAVQEEPSTFRRFFGIAQVCTISGLFLLIRVDPPFIANYPCIRRLTAWLIYCQLPFHAAILNHKHLVYLVLFSNEVFRSKTGCCDASPCCGLSRRCLCSSSRSTRRSKPI